jgi:hypothetical protein
MAAIHGLMAEFGSAGALVEAARQARERGFRHLDAFTPYPVEALDAALGLRPDRGIYLMVLAVMVSSGLLVYLLQWYTAVWDYPINVGGKPYNAWPAFIPSAFVLAVLLGGLAAALVMFVRNGIQLYHPVFNAPDFDLSARDRFYLCIEAEDPRYEPQAVRDLLRGLNAVGLMEVER